MEFQFKVVDFSSKVVDFFLLLPYFFRAKDMHRSEGAYKAPFYRREWAIVAWGG